ncbi:hypothetical protein HD554DRAFT_2173429 [Boletus coccyginus]|nr:hypothetical protein HD554DRAFT_2173429 [Boletus coccyginus]
MATFHEITQLKTGVALEVATSRPEQEHRCTRVAFCLHPWSRLGGCMYDSTVQTIVECLQDNDFYVVYYNSRGVGKSTGWPSFTGRAEGSDLEAPLPDEKPRQSVAKLIGRFELQGKRQASPALPVVPRSSSVSSQIAGDAAKEEVKEKREWPPKPVASADIKPTAPTLSSSPSSSMSKSPVVSPQPIPDPAPPADIPTTPTPASPEPVKSPPSKGKAVATGKSTPTTGTRRAAASPKKTRSSVPNSSSTKSLLSSPPKTSLQASVSQPLRSQHTGQSATSNPSTTRQARPVPRTAPSTPSRPKSSAAQNQPVVRPKTPSSGLFAPTAASLARSRYAPPPPPPPVKKVTLSSDAAERLSKPTAASLSKARTAVPTAPSPARVVKSTSAGAPGSTPRGLLKLRIGRIPVKAKEVNTKGGSNPGPASVSSEPPQDSDHLVADHIENGHESGTAAFSDVGSPEDTQGHSEVFSDATHDPAAERSDSEVHSEQQAGEHPAEDEAHGHELVTQSLPEEAAPEHEQVRLEVHEDVVPEPAESHTGEVISNGDSLKVELTAPGNDIEDIVNLLEGVSLSKPRPQSIVSIPDEEIPDEY